MTITAKLLVILVGVICLFLAGFNVVHPRLRFEWLGLAFIALGLFVLS